MSSSSADEIASFVPCPVSFLQNIMSMGLSIPYYLHGQGGRGDNSSANGASLFEEAYAESDAHLLLEER